MSAVSRPRPYSNCFPSRETFGSSINNPDSGKWVTFSGVIRLGSGRFRMQGPDGKAQIADFNPGMVIWRDATEHSWEMLSGNAHVIAVEVKPAAR